MDKVPMNTMQVYALTLLCVALGVGALSIVTLVFMAVTNATATLHVFVEGELIAWAVFSAPYALFQLYDWVKTL